ncbi:MAG: xanthine dehydrogenase family protein subunit M [Beijerinckiaceae bacterium]|nr:xanthine dehydrogenase family protein subunit M [Beijerinckiaceae bacterium]
MLSRPLDLDETLRLASEPGVRVFAGGTDIFPAAGDVELQGRFIDIGGLDACRGISRADGFIRIGAGVTWAALIAADLPPAFAALKQAAREIGSVQIQNRATLAGNLCNASPAADGVPALLILEAEVELRSLGGIRRIPLRDFITGNRRTLRAPGEIMTAILVPEPAAARSIFLKLGARRYLVISIVMVAVLLETDAGGVVRQARIAVGACSPVARRLPLAEAALMGKPALSGLGDAVDAAYLAELSPIDDVRATGPYRHDAALALVRRAVDLCAEGKSGGVA